MNLNSDFGKAKKTYIPRGCGGEPYENDLSQASNAIFPADAGVNPIRWDDEMMILYIPRGCGGEPSMSHIQGYERKYSPRMRG